MQETHLDDILEKKNPDLLHPIMKLRSIFHQSLRALCLLNAPSFKLDSL